MARGACVNSAKQWVDVSMPLFEGMVCWPGDPVFEMAPVSSLSEGDPSNVSRLLMTTHTGTHVDAPYHYCEDGARVHELSPSLFFGDAWVLEVGSRDNLIRPPDLGNAPLPPRLLLKTRNGIVVRDGVFQADFTALSPEAAVRIVDERIQLVGIDSLSIAPFGEDSETTHRILLEAGILVVEGLDLSAAKAGKCEFIVLPLAIQDGDGAPCRAFIGMEARDG